MIRSAKLATRVDTACASACTIAFLGGVERTISPSGRLGFHRASFPGMDDDDMHESNRGIRNFLVYSARLTPEFARKVIDTPAASIWVPTRAELLAGKVNHPMIPRGLPYDEAMRRFAGTCRSASTSAARCASGTSPTRWR